MRILQLIDTLDYSGSARQVQLLGPALLDAHTSVHLCSLGPVLPWSDSLQRAGVVVHTLGWTRWFDFIPLWHLRELVRDLAPDVIHVWRVSALRTLAVVAPEMLSRVVMSAPLPAKGPIAWWDRRLLQRVGCVAVAGVSDQERCLRQGIIHPALRVIPPAISVASTASGSLSDVSPSIVCVGNLERNEGFRQAVWAFDIVRQVHPHLTLKLVGAGSQLAALRSLAQGLEAGARIQFLGGLPEVADVLESAEIVWIPSQANCGRQVALEAMTLARAVVATNVPCLQEVIRDGATGCLVPVGDVIALSRRTHALLQDERLREHIGATAQQFVKQRFPLADTVERWRELYRTVAA